MPAAVETAGFANEGAWHRLGTVVDTNGNKGMTIEQALPATGLDWAVERTLTLGFSRKLAALNDPKRLADAIAAGTKIDLADLVVNQFDRRNVQRTSDGRLLGNVGGTWHEFNPSDAFAIVDDLVREAGAKTWIEAGGSLDDGRKVWITVHIDSGMMIAGEKYATYMTVVTGFDGRTSTMVFFHEERIVCANTLAIGIGQAKHSGRIIRVRHTKNAANRIKQARSILGLRDVRAEELARQGEWLVEQTMDDGEFAAFLDSLMPLPEDEGPAHTMRQERRGLVSKLYFEAENLKPITGTRWGALQATIEYADHKRAFKDDESQMKAQLGFTAQNTELKDRAYAILRSPDLVVA